MRKLTIRLIAVSLPVLVFLPLAEMLLRQFPSLIGPAFLERFPTDLSKEIALAVGLPVSFDYTKLSSEERSDGGIDLYLPKPHKQYNRRTEADDLAAGALTHWETDQNGFCNTEGLSGNRKFDLVVLGGSVPSCVGVDATTVFSRRLALNTGLEIYDLTLGNTGPYDYVELLKRFGLSLRPRAVLLSYSYVNDLRDCQRHLQNLKGKKFVHRFERNGGWLVRNSYVLSFIKAGAAIGLRTIKASATENLRYSVTVRGKPVQMNGRNGDHDEIESAREVAQGKLSIDMCKGAFEEFVKISRSSNFLPIILGVPGPHGIYLKNKVWQSRNQQETFSRYIELQKGWLAENAAGIGYVFLDVGDELINPDESNALLFFPNDTHWSAAGHLALSRAVAPKLLKLLATVSPR